MPTYEYRCNQGHTFDLFQKMSDEPASKCSVCGEPVERVVSGGAGFLFRGEGFYITDYRSEEYRKKAEAEKVGEAPAPAEAGSDAGSAGAGDAASKSDAGEGKDACKRDGGSSPGSQAAAKPPTDD